MTGRVDIPSEFGTVILLWNRNSSSALVRRILLSKPGSTAESAVERLFPSAVISRCSETDNVAEHIFRVLEGRGRPFAPELLDITVCAPFQESVLLTERKIPPGSVSTYGRLAEAMGRPGSARAVGTALARNPFPLLIPCHRVVRADGSIGGFQGGGAMKRILLEREGLLLSSSADRVLNPRWYPGE